LGYPYRRKVAQLPRNKACLLGSAILASVLLAAGCAGLINGSKQWVPVTSTPRGAAVFVNGVREGATPLELYLQRDHKAPVIRIESPGYDPVEIRVTKRASGLPLLGNIMFGLGPALFPAGRYYVAHDGEGALGVWLLWAAAFGAVFTAIDTASGSVNEFDPKEIVVTLKKADGPPKVETILLEERDFRNIKWIRVRGG
jgi:hypothetical protein